MFTKYELQILREAVISDLLMWQEKVDSGVDVSEKFMKTLESLETKIEHMIVELE